jgi:LacI family transcriptional regulator
VRLNRARQLLVETEFPLSLVAEKIGLEHAEYLNVIFKKKTGLTPGQFRAHGKAPQLPSAPGPQPQPIHTP